MGRAQISACSTRGSWSLADIAQAWLTTRDVVQEVAQWHLTVDNLPERHWRCHEDRLHYDARGVRQRLWSGSRMGCSRRTCRRFGTQDAREGLAEAQLVIARLVVAP